MTSTGQAEPLSVREVLNSLIDQMKNWVRSKVRENAADGALVGLSGGVDSSAVAGILKRALPDSCLGVILPCRGTSSADEKYAHQVAEKFNIPTTTVDLTRPFCALRDVLGPADIDRSSTEHWPRTAVNISSETGDPALENSKPRLRMLALYYVAESLNYLVAGTTNRSEILTGYYTNHGDLAADFGLLADLLKTQVWELAEELEVPSAIINRPPSAGMAVGQTDEDELGITYRRFDAILQSDDPGESAEEEEISRVNELIARAEDKDKKPVFRPDTRS